MFKRGTTDSMIINKQGCASCSSKKRGHHFVVTKLTFLLQEAIKFFLHNSFFLYWKYHIDSNNWNTNGI